MILFDAVASGSSMHPDRPALIDGDTIRTYRQVADRVLRLATVLADQGCRPGTRVAVLSRNSPDVVEVILAASRLGAAVVPLNHRLVGPEIEFQITDADVVLALVEPRFRDLATTAGLRASGLVLLDDDHQRAIETALVYEGPRPRSDAVLVQLYTSGTTGRPKGCVLSQANWVAAATSFAHAYAIGSKDVVLTALPLFHVASMSWTIATLLSGGTVVVPRELTADAFWDLAPRHGVTVVAAPFAVGPILKHPSATTPASRTLRLMVGAPSRLATEVVPHVAMASGYGATELCGQVIAISGDEFTQRPDALGRLMTGCAAAVVDADGVQVSPGGTGELVVRGPNTSRGYWKLPQASGELLQDGWLHTGDLVQVDQDGVFVFVDRLKDMIKTGGENVYSAEVEAVLTAHPAVKEAGVVGVPDEVWGQAVKACVVARDESLTFAELDAWCLKNLAPYKRPRWYELVDGLPRNASGKIMKAQLRTLHDPEIATRLTER